jgi:hypothetical protein
MVGTAEGQGTTRVTAVLGATGRARAILRYPDGFARLVGVGDVALGRRVVAIDEGGLVLRGADGTERRLGRAAAGP